MGRIEDKRLERKEQDKPLGSLGSRDKPKDVSITEGGTLRKKKKNSL
ncbi:hypothetical protein ACE939_01310 [Aquimarina sp. W85]